MHVGVGFAFHRDVGICPAVHEQADKPFDYVPQIEPDESHLQHLSRVYALVLNEFERDAGSLAAEKQSEEIDGIVLLEGYKPVVDDSHDDF